MGYDYNRTGSIKTIVDIFRSVRPYGTFIDNPSMYSLYQIENGDRPDIVSNKLYDTPDYYWTFFIINEFLHDGLASWPMSEEDVREYLDLNYYGQVIETRPEITSNTDDLLLKFRNSISDRFELGETVIGQSSAAPTGKLIRKNADLSQLVIENLSGKFSKGEVIVGERSNSQVQVYNVYDHEEAPNYWYVTGDEDRKPVTPDTVIGTANGVPRHTLSYVSNRERIYARNDENSRIRVINPNYVADFAEQFEELINV